MMQEHEEGRRRLDAVSRALDQPGPEAVRAVRDNLLEELPLAGTEIFSWTGGNPTITNDVFSFDKYTIITGNITYQGVNQGMSTFRIRGAGLTNGAVDPTVPLTLTVNQMMIKFDNATKSDNFEYTYTKSKGDLYTRLVLDTRSKTWQVDMSGKRLTHSTWPEDLSIGLQIGPGAARATVNPEINAHLRLQKKESIQADFTAVPKTGTPPLSVQFSDLSCGHPNAWSWTFGDGSSSDRQDPVHAYNSEGTYNVTLTVSNSEGSSTLDKANYIIVNPPPEPTLLANFTVSPVTGTAPLTVKCTDKSTGMPTIFMYNFGDGTYSMESNPVHTYRFPGRYNITLVAMKYNATTNSMMKSVATKPNAVRVFRAIALPPVARFTASPVTGKAPLTVAFTDQSIGKPTFYNYNFGDGMNMTSKNPVHTYRYPGTYNVTLTVMKNDVATATMILNSSVQTNLIVVNSY